MSTVGPSVLFGLVGGLISGCLVVPIVLIVTVVLLPPWRCPNCGVAQARFSRPRTLDQALWGSRTCPSCGHNVPGRAVRKTK